MRAKPGVKAELIKQVEACFRALTTGAIYEEKLEAIKIVRKELEFELAEHIDAYKNESDLARLAYLGARLTLFNSIYR